MSKLSRTLVIVALAVVFMLVTATSVGGGSVEPLAPLQTPSVTPGPHPAPGAQP